VSAGPNQPETPPSEYESDVPAELNETGLAALGTLALQTTVNKTPTHFSHPHDVHPAQLIKRSRSFG
jgi:hypothetical protein